MGLSRLEQYRAPEWTMRLRRSWSGWSEDGLHHFAHSGSTGVLHIRPEGGDNEVGDLDIGRFAQEKSLSNPSPFQTKAGFSGSVFGLEENSIIGRSWVLRKERFLFYLSVTGFYRDEPDRARDIDHMIQSLKLTGQKQIRGED